MVKTGKCYYCGEPLLGRGHRSNKFPRGNRYTKDHVVPKAMGGGGEGNYVAACEICNQEKGALSVDEYRAVVAMREGFLSVDFVKTLWRFHGEIGEQDRKLLEDFQ